MYEPDFDGDLSVYQKQLDEAGIDFDISTYAGCTQREIKCIMGGLLMFAPDKRVVQDAI